MRNEKDNEFRQRTWVKLPLDASGFPLMHTHFFENHYHCECDNHKQIKKMVFAVLQNFSNRNETLAKQKRTLFSGSC